MPLRTLEPIELIHQCPEVNETFAYTVTEGTIQEDWLNFDLQARLITFWTPASFEEQTVDTATILVNITHTVTSPQGTLYTSMSETFKIRVSKSQTGFCIPEGFGLAPSVMNIKLHLDDDASQVIVPSKSRNVNCTDTTFSIQYANNSAVDP